MEKPKSLTRRFFIQKSILASAGLCLFPQIVHAEAECDKKPKVPVFGHLWVYASKFPPHWDAYPDLENAFADMSYAGLDGIELMESILRHDDAVTRIMELINKYNFPVSGSSYGVDINMWDKCQHSQIQKDLAVVIPRLAKVGGTTFGVSVGDADHVKTEAELDAQAEIFKVLMKICEDHGVIPNLHNHTYEVDNDFHDLKAMLARIPDVKLGPDINWLIRAGVDPIEFINAFGKKIVYVHIRDQYENGDWTEYVGQGNTDFVRIAKALKEQGFKGQAAIELAFQPDFKQTMPLHKNWKLSRENIRKSFGW